MPAGWVALGTAAMGAVSQFEGGAATNASNAAINQAQMDWQTEMSNTAMQRRVVDLRAAGLNPLLAVSQGGASTPGFAPIAMQNPAAGMGQAGAQAGANIVGALNTQADTDLKNAQAANIRGQTGQQPVFTNLANAQIDQIRQSIGESRQKVSAMAVSMGLDYATTQQVLAGIPGVTADSNLKQMNADTFKKTMESLIERTISDNQTKIAENGYDTWLVSSDEGKVIKQLGPGVEAGAAQFAANLLKNSGVPKPQTNANSPDKTWSQGMDDFKQWSASHGGKPVMPAFPGAQSFRGGRGVDRW